MTTLQKVQLERHQVPSPVIESIVLAIIDLWPVIAGFVIGILLGIVIR